jgi:hypothetical protein
VEELNREPFCLAIYKLLNSTFLISSLEIGMLYLLAHIKYIAKLFINLYDMTKRKSCGSRIKELKVSKPSMNKKGEEKKG